MAKLIRKYEAEREDSCNRLTNIMKEVVKNENEVDGYIHPSNKPRERYFTNCISFRNFVNEVNSNSGSQIRLQYNPGRVDMIRTDIDLEEKMVTYKLF
jgi:hypothetical protein